MIKNIMKKYVISWSTIKIGKNKDNLFDNIKIKNDITTISLNQYDGLHIYIFLLFLFNKVYKYYNLSYSPSVTSSHHSFDVFSPGTSTAI